MSHVGQGTANEFLNGSRDFNAPPGDQDLGGAFLVLDDTASTAVINSGLAAYNIVYLKPGTYTWDEQIVVPNSKQLIGLASTGADEKGTSPLASGTVTLTCSIDLGTDGVAMGEWAALKNIFFRSATTQTTSTNGVASSGSSRETYSILERVRFDWSAVSGAVVHITKGEIINSVIVGSQVGQTGVILGPKAADAGDARPSTVLINSSVSAAHAVAILTDTSSSLGNTNVRIIHNTLNATAGHGIYCDSASPFPYTNVEIGHNRLVGGGVAGNGIEGFLYAGENVDIHDNWIGAFSASAPDGISANLGAAALANFSAYQNNIGQGCRVNSPAAATNWFWSGNRAV